MKDQKKFVILIVIIFLIIFLGCLFVPSLFSNSNLPEEVTIIQYKAGGFEKIKEVKIEDQSKIKKLSKYVNKLKPLSEKEMVRLALLQEIEIIYDDSISIGIQLEEESYCYYINKDENISSLSKMPSGLLKWVKNNLDL